MSNNGKVITCKEIILKETPITSIPNKPPVPQGNPNSDSVTYLIENSDSKSHFNFKSLKESFSYYLQTIYHPTRHPNNCTEQDVIAFFKRHHYETKEDDGLSTSEKAEKFLEKPLTGIVALITIDKQCYRENLYLVDRALCGYKEYITNKQSIENDSYEISENIKLYLQFKKNQITDSISGRDEGS